MLLEFNQKKPPESS